MTKTLTPAEKRKAARMLAAYAAEIMKQVNRLEEEADAADNAQTGTWLVGLGNLLTSCYAREGQVFLLGHRHEPNRQGGKP